MTQRDAWKIYVRFVVRPAPLAKRAALRALFDDAYAACCPLFNFWYWSRRPLKWLHFRRVCRLYRQGIGEFYA